MRIITYNSSTALKKIQFLIEKMNSYAMFYSLPYKRFVKKKKKKKKIKFTQLIMKHRSAVFLQY